MGQITSGVRSVLSIPAVYDFFQNLTGARSARREFVENYVGIRSGDSVLDIGCGTAQILEFLPSVRYFGFDSSREYIEAARGQFGKRGTFMCQNVNQQTLQDLPQFDIVLATGVLHHLNDDEALDLFRLAGLALKPGGRLVTFDGCFEEGQSRIARYIIAKDRGQFVRTKKGYVDIASKVFENVKTTIRHDLLRIPYTHIIMECTK